jgi:hypothetical protein
MVLLRRLQFFCSPIDLGPDLGRRLHLASHLVCEGPEAALATCSPIDLGPDLGAKLKVSLAMCSSIDLGPELAKGCS